jgi:uncharacterized protein YPO0396
LLKTRLRARFGTRFGARFGARLRARFGSRFGARFGARFGTGFIEKSLTVMGSSVKSKNQQLTDHLRDRLAGSIHFMTKFSIIECVIEDIKTPIRQVVDRQALLLTKQVIFTLDRI